MIFFDKNTKREPLKITKLNININLENNSLEEGHDETLEILKDNCSWLRVNSCRRLCLICLSVDILKYWPNIGFPKKTKK